MTLTRVYPGAPEAIDLHAEDSRPRLLDLYRPPGAQWLRINLVASVSGSAAGSDGTSETLTNRSDRRILGVIRELSDVVLVGAASVRAEGYRLPKRSRLAVVTATGDLSGHRLGMVDPTLVTVVCAGSAVPRVRETLGDAEILTVDATNNRISPAELVAAVRDAGYLSIVCEGGPGLASQLIGASLVDDLCLTTSPVVGSVSLPLLERVGLPETPATLGHLMVDDASYVFARWALASAGVQASH